MKKILIVISAVCVVFLAAALIFSSLPEKETKPRQPIVITTVSGETASKHQNFNEIIENHDDKNNNMPDTILGSNVSVAQGDTDNKVYYYCGNKNSKIYHKISCNSAKKTREENKVYFNSPEDCQNAGYKPCKICSE